MYVQTNTHTHIFVENLKSICKLPNNTLTDILQSSARNCLSILRWHFLCLSMIFLIKIFQKHSLLQILSPIATN